MNHDHRPWRDDEEDWSKTGDDEDADLDSESAPCPECGAAIYADLDHCSQCGHWLTDADHRALDRGSFPSCRVRIVALIILVIFVLVLLAGSIGM